MAKQIVKTTCPRDCYDSCGIAVIKRDGRITKVLGDPDHFVSRGALCGKCALAYNGVYLDPNARLTRPLKRIGVKGEGRFEPVSWDQAMADIAARLNGVIADGGRSSPTCFRCASSTASAPARSTRIPSATWPATWR